MEVLDLEFLRHLRLNKLIRLVKPFAKERFRRTHLCFRIFRLEILNLVQLLLVLNYVYWRLLRTQSNNTIAHLRGILGRDILLRIVIAGIIQQ